MTIGDLKYLVDEARDELVLDLAVAVYTGKSVVDLKNATIAFDRVREQFAKAKRDPMYLQTLPP